VIRRILCPTCAEKFTLHPIDKRDGFQIRQVMIKAHTPPNHGLTVNKEFHALHCIVCDNCGQSVAEGSPAFAVTMWKGQTPPPWEHEYHA